MNHISTILTISLTRYRDVATIDAVVRDKGPAELVDRTATYWRARLRQGGKGLADLPTPLQRLYCRSLLVIRTQIDHDGAVIVANDADVLQFGRDTSSYMWPRDGARHQPHDGEHDEREQPLNQLLAEMDGFDTHKGVMLLAATNHPKILDPALLPPGHFDRQVVIDRPDLQGRSEIRQVHTQQVTLAPDVDLGQIAARTPGFVGADLANLVNEAALRAAREGKDAVALVDFEDAMDRVVAGREHQSRIISPKEKTILAYHEAGHALVAESRAHADRGPLPDDAHGAARSPRRPAGWAHRRGDRLGRYLHWGTRRPPACHGPGPPHDDPAMA